MLFEKNCPSGFKPESACAKLSLTMKTVSILYSHEKNQTKQSKLHLALRSGWWWEIAGSCFHFTLSLLPTSLQPTTNRALSTHFLARLLHSFLAHFLKSLPSTHQGKITVLGSPLDRLMCSLMFFTQPCYTVSPRFVSIQVVIFHTRTSRQDTNFQTYEHSTWNEEGFQLPPPTSRCCGGQVIMGPQH